MPRNRISPPIVGVPALAWCSCGPSSRICCPNSFTRRYSMNRGPTKIVISIAAIPAIRTSPRSIRSPPFIWASSSTIGPSRQKLVGETLEPDRARALDQHRVARPQQLVGHGDRLLRVGHPFIGGVVAGELADADDRADPQAAREGADLPVVFAGFGAQLEHAAHHGDAAALHGHRG